MKELSHIQNLLFQLGAIIILIGVVLWMPRFQFAPYVYTFGSILFGSMQLLQKYEGTSFVIKRLRRQQLGGAAILIFTGIMMIGSLFHLPYTTRNEWIICLVVGTIFELYTAFRIPAELKKEGRG